MQFFVVAALDPDDDADEDEGHRGHDDETVVFVADVVESDFFENGVSPEGSASEEFAHEAQDNEDDAVAESVADAVEERIPWAVGHCESFESSHDDAVGDDKSHVNGQLFADIVYESHKHLVDEDDEGGDDDELDDDTDAGRYALAHQRDDKVRECHHDGDGECHHDGRFELGCHCEAGADAEDLYGDGVVLAEGVGYEFFLVAIHCWPPFAERLYSLGSVRVRR